MRLVPVLVSIPFIAGQWSLRGSARRQGRRRRSKFQSPSLRGSGRFQRGVRPVRGGRRVSIPFIAGQWSLLNAIRRALPALAPVSIPFIAGQWSLLRSGRSAPKSARVSIPFIAGQWSLPALAVWRAWAETTSQSPSLRGSGRFAVFFAAAALVVAGLNPLHCGAVVASQAPRSPPGRVRGSQSPSLRGSGRFSAAGATS